MKACAWFVAVGLALGGVAPSLGLAAVPMATGDTPVAANADVTVAKTANTSQVSLNNASATSLATVKGLGPNKAQAIVNYRQQHGNFTSVADVAKVPGIGPKLLAKIEPSLTL